jgi:hypothetical protein
MAQMAEAGHSYPTIVTSVIVAVLALWSLYALSGAGVIIRLPLLRLGLCIIASIYLLRGIVFIPLMPMFPENSITFWLVSSAICFVFGLMYVLGIKKSWAYLGNSKT